MRGAPRIADVCAPPRAAAAVAGVDRCGVGNGGQGVKCRHRFSLDAMRCLGLAERHALHRADGVTAPRRTLPSDAALARRVRAPAGRSAKPETPTPLPNPVPIPLPLPLPVGGAVPFPHRSP
jgi:hypothetical protein